MVQLTRDLWDLARQRGACPTATGRSVEIRRRHGPLSSLAALALAACAACGPNASQATRRPESSAWSYAHAMVFDHDAHRFDFDWEQPDPTLSAQGSPQIRCRVLDVAEHRCPAPADGESLPPCEPKLTWMIQLQVLWTPDTKPRYIGLGDSFNLAFIPVEMGPFDTDLAPDEDPDADAKIFRYALPARGRVVIKPSSTRWRESQAWLERDRSRRSVVSPRWMPNRPYGRWLQRFAPIVVQAPPPAPRERPASFGVLAIEERGAGASLDRATEHVLVRHLHWLVDGNRPETVEPTLGQVVGCRLTLPRNVTRSGRHQTETSASSEPQSP